MEFNLQSIIDDTPHLISAKEAAKEYMSKGWTAPLPLPAGSKFPPPKDTTGNIKNLTKEQVRKLWVGKKESNLALRLQTNTDFEIISLDVDHYGTKQGRLFLREKEETLGSLNLEEVPYSTRRGADSLSGQFFFKVPKGLKWESSACADVDIVQKTHRYSAVWPSIVDGTQYRWYVNGEECEIPDVNDLPELPEAWVKHLTSGKVGKQKDPSERKFNSNYAGDNFRQAMRWIRENMRDYAADDMSGALRSASDSDALRDKLTMSGHDTMVAAVHSCLALGMEGHCGLKLAFSRLYKNFEREVTLNREGANLRTKKQAKKEFADAVVSEVERLIASGAQTPKEIYDDIDLSGFRDVIADLEAETREVGVDLDKYENSDRGHADMFVDYWRRDVMSTGSKNKEFVLWDKKRGRFEFRDMDQMFHLLHRATAERIQHEADVVKDNIKAWLQKAESEQIPAEIDLDEMSSYANNLHQRAIGIFNTPGTLRVLRQLRSYPKIQVDLSEFDMKEDVIGLPDAQTLETDTLTVRRSTRKDMLTMTTAVLPSTEYHPAWVEFLGNVLPDPDLRRFTQKCLGYTLVDGNPDKLVFFLKGPANTGKTTILEACVEALGDYGGPANAASLLSRQRDRPSPDKVQAMRKRMVIMSEVGTTHTLSIDAVKQLTGNDSQTHRELYSNVYVNGRPKYTPYISTNQTPNIPNIDSAMMSRIVVLPFQNRQKPGRITPEKDVKNNKKILASVLQWLIDGLEMYLKEGLSSTEWESVVKDEVSRFVEDASPFTQFFNENFKMDPDEEMLENEAYAIWKVWHISQADGSEELTKRQFRKQIKETQGIEVKRTQRIIDGVRGNVYVMKGITKA